MSTLDALVAKTIEPVPQPEDGVTYAHKLGKEEGALDWRRPAAELERKVRAFHPWPGTWFDVRHGERIKVLGAALALAGGAPGTVSIGRDGFPVVACGVGGLKLLKLQRAGKSAQAADAFLRGFALAAGTVLAPPAVVPLPTPDAVPRYKLTIEYDGAPFVGWQRQDNGPSIQGALEDAVFAFCGERVGGPGRGPHRHRRACAGPGRASRSCRGEARRHRAGGGELPSQAQPDRRHRGRDRAGRLPCPLLGDGAALSLPDPEPPRAAGARSRPGLARAGAARCRGHGRCGPRC